MPKKRWQDLSERTRRMIILAATVEGILKLLALVDIKRRPDSAVRGSRGRWAAAVLFVNSAGVVPIAYFLFGREADSSLG